MSGGTYIPKTEMSQATKLKENAYRTSMEDYYDTAINAYEQGRDLSTDRQVLGYRAAMNHSFMELMKKEVPSIVDVTRPKNAPKRKDAYSGFEAKKKRKEYSKAASKGKVYRLNMKDFADSGYMDSLLSERVSNCEHDVKTQRDLYEKCKAGVFNDFEKLDPILRDTLAIEYTREKMGALLRAEHTLESIVDALDESMGHEGLAHPLLRLGISLGMRGQATFEGLKAEDCKKLDDLLNQRIMRNTLINEISVEEGQKLIDDGVMTSEQLAQAKERDLTSRTYIMKSLLLAQLGKFRKVSGKDKKEENWDVSIASAFSHCSRVMYTLPSEHTKQTSSTYTPDMLTDFRKKYVGDGQGITPGTGFEVRTSATHRASAATKKGKAKEQKMRLGWYWDQSGINVAVGGLGKKGIAGRPLLNDGSCGHLYRYYRQGDKGEHGIMMLGFESDAYKKKNQLGHTHGLGNGEYCSSFGGQRVDEIGNKYGGRTVDASGIDLDLVNEMFDKIDDIMQNKDHLPEDEQIERMTELADLLSGKRIEDNPEKQVRLFELLLKKPRDVMQAASSITGMDYQQACITLINKGWR